MSRISGKLAVVLATSTLALFAGCDGTPSVSSSTTEAVVKGTVTVRGKKADSGSVVFDPTNIRRRDVSPRTAPIAKDGTYSITTLIGDNTISVTGPIFDRDEQVGISQYVLDVPTGESTFDIALPQ